MNATKGFYISNVRSLLDYFWAIQNIGIGIYKKKKT